MLVTRRAVQARIEYELVHLQRRIRLSTSDKRAIEESGAS